MNHPSSEDWVLYLYGDAPRNLRRELKLHLASCEACRSETARLRATMRQLNAWELPRRPLAATLRALPLRWAPLAAVLLFSALLAFFAGRVSGNRAAAEVRATLEPELRRQLSAELTQLVNEQVKQVTARAFETANEQTRATFAAYFEAVDEMRANDLKQLYASFLTLKRDLDTVALHTDAGLRFAEQQLIRLADSRPSGTSPND